MAKMAILLIVAFLLRLYGVDWDQWGQLHPDERMLMMVADKIRFFSNLNPDFFNYGSLPVYLLRIFHPSNDYYTLVKTGRYLSIFFDLVTVLFVYKIAARLFKNSAISLAAGFFYAIAFFPIQNSHFFVVDVLLTTLTTVLLYRLLIFFNKPSVKSVVLIGVVFAAMMATKFTAIVFMPFITGIIFLKEFRNLKKLFILLSVFGLTFTLFFFFFMPYAFIEYKRFITDITAQLKMNSDPYTFPFTLQYVGTLPYLHYLKNIFFWGLGPVISAISIIGFVNSKKYFKKAGYLIFVAFLFYYVLLIGRSSVKFMRYMLPVYPLFAVLAGYGLSRVKEISKYLALVLVMGAVIWTAAFVNIYSYTHTRIAATEWIKKNIPEGKTLAVEHWDDRLPVGDSGSYEFEELTLYDWPDNEFKWKSINEKLGRSDYIIVASNRLYAPLSKLTDCKKYRVCYGKTAEYYERLFNNRLPFRKIVEFQSYPGITIGKYRFSIDDQSADESFTVYDHPKIMIYKKLH